MKKKLIAAVTALAMVASTGSIVFADEAVDYDVENHEFKDVTITLHTRWDEADISGPLYQDIVNGFMEKYPGITVECINIPTESEWLNSESVLMSDESSMPNIIQEYGGSRTAGYIEQDLIVDMSSIRNGRQDLMQWAKVLLISQHMDTKEATVFHSLHIR